jgi:hypothetical protein
MSDNPENRLAKAEEEQIETDQLGAPSQKKLKANRENAKMSTGPKTLRGKAHSRRNALTHGLFARHSLDFFLQGEDSSEYEELFKDLRQQSQPVGRAEELEVERITLCWWRLKRAWRYENAENRVAMRDLGRKELAYQNEHLKDLDKKDQDLILHLRNLHDEIEATDAVPADFKQKLIAARPEFESVWSLCEAVAQRRAEDPGLSKLAEELSAEERKTVLAAVTVTIAINFIEHLRQFRNVNVRENVYARHVLPEDGTLDKMLRYETAIERNLARALDRLDRLQRRRKGEPALPPLSVRLT